MSNDQEAELWRAALEETLRGMSEADFHQLVARTRPPDEYPLPPGDVAARHRAHKASMAAKTQQLLAVPCDENGALNPPRRTEAPPPNPPTPTQFTDNRAQSHSGGAPPEETERDRNIRLLREIRSNQI